MWRLIEHWIAGPLWSRCCGLGRRNWAYEVYMGVCERSYAEWEAQHE